MNSVAMLSIVASMLLCQQVGPPLAVAQVQTAPPVDRESKDPIVEGAAAGAFLPYSSSASLTAYRAAVGVDAGYDGVREGTVGRLRAELVLLGRKERRWSNANLSLFGGGGYGAGERPGDSQAYGYGGLKLQPLVQTVHGVDLATSLAYTSRGFNLLPAVAGEVVLSKRFGALTTLFSAAYGQSVEDADRYAALGVAALLRVAAPLFVGVDAKLSGDLERDQDEPAFEPQVEAVGSGLLSYVSDFVTLTARGGLRAVQYRLHSQLLIGRELGVSASTAL